MQAFRPFAIAILLGCLPVLAACSSGQSSSSGGLAGTIDSTVTTALDNAQTQLRTEPLDVSPGNHLFPEARITPQGDFIVGGKTVAITPVQRDALLAYREQMISIGSAGIALGKQGAALGLHAASTAITDALSGKSDQEIQQSVKAQAIGIHAAAAKLCDRLPAMMAEQQKLAAVLPAFKPYATMTEKDISDCHTDALKHDD